MSPFPYTFPFDFDPADFPGAISLEVRIAFVDTPLETSPTWVNIASDIRELHTLRGRNHELDRMESGTLDLVLNNQSGDYWPDYAGTYTPNVDVMKKINVRAFYNGWHNVFTGYIESYKPSWLSGAYGSLMTLHCVGAIGKILSLQVLNNAGYAAELSGTRVNNVLTSCSWVSSWATLDAGDETIASTGAITNINALNHLQKVQETELGLLYELPNGNIIYEGRGHRTEAPHTSSDAIFSEALTATLTLRPNDAGDETSITSQFPDSDYHWDKVDEAVTDDSTTYISTILTDYLRDLYALPAHTTESGNINSVTIYFRVYSPLLSTVYAKPSQKSGTTVTDGTEVSHGGPGWVTYSQTYTTNPATSVAYTWSEIDALQVGLQLKTSNAKISCTQVYVEVDYEPAHYTSFKYVKDEVLLFNDARITRTGGAEQTHSSSTSQVNYGKRSFVKSGTLHNSDVAAEVFGNYICARYATPVGRIESMTIVPDDSTKWTQIFTREISDRITFRNDAAGINKDYFIEAIQHDWNFVTRDFKTEYKLSDATQYFTALDSQMETLLPTASGALTQLIPDPASTANWACVNAIGGAYVAVVSTETAYPQDTYTLQNLGWANSTVSKVIVNYTVLNNKATPNWGTARPIIRIASTNYYGASVTPTQSWTSYSQTFLLNPATSADWTVSTVNNMQLGIECQGSAFASKFVWCDYLNLDVYYTPIW